MALEKKAQKVKVDAIRKHLDLVGDMLQVVGVRIDNETITEWGYKLKDAVQVQDNYRTPIVLSNGRGCLTGLLQLLDDAERRLGIFQTDPEDFQGDKRSHLARFQKETNRIMRLGQTQITDLKKILEPKNRIA